MSGEERENPYVGLKPFFEEDAPKFFGRREQTNELIEILHSTHFVGVVGSSGCGKSSLIRAGLIPAIKAGFLAEKRSKWQFAVMRPGDSPRENLARELLEATGRKPSREEVQELLGKILEDHTYGVLEHLEKQLGDDSNLLLLVDQFEEIFAFRGDDAHEEDDVSESRLRERSRCREEASDFVDILVDLANLNRKRRKQPIYTVLTMRTDFLGDCDLFYGLPEAMNRGRYLVPRLTRDQLRRAIASPVRMNHAELAPRLLDTLLNQLGDRMDRLPVLQHALFRTWDCWDGEGMIDLEHYEAAGGLEGALAQDAEDALTGLDPRAVGKVFRRLTKTDTSHRRVRDRATMSELEESTGLGRAVIERILHRFGKEKNRNFVHTRPGAVEGDDRVDISHESLIRQWGRMRDWVDEEYGAREQFEELVKKARSGASRLRGPELHVATEWETREQPDAGWAKRYRKQDDDYERADAFLQKSKHEATVTRRLKVGGVVAALVVFLGAALTGLWFFKREEERADKDLITAARARIAAGEPDAAGLLLGDLHGEPRGTLDVIRKVWEWGLVHRLSREGASSPIVRCVFSADGTRVAVIDERHDGGVWNLAGDPKWEALPKAKLVSASFSPGGDHLVTISKERKVLVWSREGESWTPATLDAELELATVASFGPSSEPVRIVTACSRGIRIWEQSSNGWEAADRKFDPFADHDPKQAYKPSVLTAAFDGSGGKVVLGSATGRVWLWNWESKRRSEVRRLDGPKTRPAHDGAVVDVAFAADGGFVTCSWTGGVAVWKADGWPQRRLSHDRAVAAAAFGADGTVVTACEDGIARVWNTTGDGEPEMLKGHTGPLLAVSFGNGGKKIVTASEDGTVRLWAREKAVWTEERTLENQRGAYVCGTFDPTGQRILSSASAAARPGKGDATKAASTAFSIRVWEPGLPTVEKGAGESEARWLIDQYAKKTSSRLEEDTRELEVLQGAVTGK